MKIAIGSDHGGFNLKGILVEYLRGKGHEVVDVGTHSSDSVDYPDFAEKVGDEIQRGNAELGIMIDGAGIGSAMALNKMDGILAAVCNELYVTKNSKAHNNANVMTLGSMVVGPGLAKQLVDAFIETPFEGGRHERRVSKIHGLSSKVLGYDSIKKIVTEVVSKLYGSTSKQNVPPTDIVNSKRVLTEKDILEMKRNGKSIKIGKGTIVTPLARDCARENGIELVFGE